MLSYLYIEQLFSAILAQDSVIQGRFHTCPYEGAELNTPDIGDILKRTLGDKPKYPAVLLMPPVCMPNYRNAGQKDEYSLSLLFVTKTGVSGNGMIKSPAADGLTGHTIPMDWHDMKRCADEFYKVLLRLIDERSLFTFFTITGDKPTQIPITTAANDRVSGIQFNFQCTIFTGACTLEQYTPDGIASIALPSTDTHPTHKH